MHSTNALENSKERKQTQQQFLLHQQTILKYLKTLLTKLAKLTKQQTTLLTAKAMI